MATSITERAPDREPHPQSAILTPADELVGIVSTRRDDGSVGVQMRPLARCVDDSGDIAAGALFVMADVILGHACVRRLPPDSFIVTSNMHLDLVARPTLTGGDIGGTGRVDAIDEFGMMCRGDLVDPAGRLIAVTTGRFAVVPRTSRNAGTVTTPAAVAPQAVRAPAGNGSIADAVPMHELLGLELIESEGSVFRFSMTTGPALSNDRGGIHGGIGALMGEQAAGQALRRMLPPATRMRPVEIRACFFRPIEAGGVPVECTAEVLHVGRRLAATRARVSTPDGRLAVLVDVLHAPAA